VLDLGEECDGSDLGGATCLALGLGGGMLGCNADCAFNVSACDHCGNGTVEAGEGEQCDGSDLGGETCLTLGFSGGPLACTASCTFDTSDCTAGGSCGPSNCEGCCSVDECLPGVTSNNCGMGGMPCDVCWEIAPDGQCCPDYISGIGGVCGFDDICPM